MTSLVLGVALGALGQMVGIPFAVGFLAGSMIGSLLDPPKVQGPRLNDLKIQSATYGKMIPFFWGAGRIAGNIIDQTDLKEHQQKSGGKGGPVTTNYTYSASYDIMLGAARRFGEDTILGILRIWADGRLIWSSTDGTPIPCTVYVGSETQLPDPTFEAVHGVGQVPAYRGYAHCVFTDQDLTDFGNRIPSYEFEVYTSAGTYPWQVIVGNPWFESGFSVPSFTYENGIITVVNSSATTDVLSWKQFDIGFNQIGSSVYSAPVVGGLGQHAAINSLTLGIISGGSNLHWCTPDATGTFTQGFDYTLTGNTSPSAPEGNLCVAQNGYVYGVTDSAPFYVNRYAEGSGFDLATAVVAVSHTAIAMGTSDTGDIYLIYNDPSFTNCEMWKFDKDLNLVFHWDAASLSGTRLTNGTHNAPNFVVYKNQVCFPWTSGTTHYAALVDIDPVSHAATDSVHGPLIQAAEGRFATLAGGLVMNANNGVFSLDPPLQTVLLSTIVGDLSDMTPAMGAYDVSELTDPVRWFVIGSQMTVRNALQSLRQAFFFDGVESDDLIKFRKRSETSTFAISDAELCAREYGEDSGDPLRTIRTREQELPRTVTLTYIDVDTDYQTGAQTSPRQTTLSQQDVAVEVPIGLTSQEAMQKCWTLMTAAWVERETFEWSTTRTWAFLEPCDVGLVRGRVLRIKTRTESPNGVIKWTGVLAAPSIYTNPAASLYIQPSVGTPGSGFIPPTPPGAKAPSRLILMNLPLINDADYATGYYAAISGNPTAPPLTVLPPGAVDIPWVLGANSRTFLTNADGADSTCVMGFVAPSVNGSRRLIASVESAGSHNIMRRWTLALAGGATVTQFYARNTSILCVTGSTPVPGFFNLQASAAYTLTAEDLQTDGFTPSYIAPSDFQVDSNNVGGPATTPGTSWTGAELFKSSDGGTTYNTIASSTNADTIGDVALALGDFGGGNTFDEGNIITVVITSGATLSSASELAVLNGANECAIGSNATGWEVLQFKTATLIAVDTYRLSGLLRGRRGTDWMQPLHLPNEVLVMLPTSINVNGPASELNLSRKFKAVSYGLTLAGATAQDFTNTGVAVKPYSPVQVGGGRNAAGDIIVNWTRRTRIGGAWLDFVDAPLSEAVESYLVNYYTNSGRTTIARSVYVSTQTATYLAADQTSDFGSLQSPIYGSVQQVGAYGNGYAALFVV